MHTCWGLGPFLIQNMEHESKADVGTGISKTMSPFRKYAYKGTTNTFAVCVVVVSMGTLLTSGAVIIVLAVTVVVATEIDTPQGVCVGLESDGVQQDSECIHCNSLTCIAKNANDSTYIRFVSEIFVLEDILHISNKGGIHFEGIAQPETRIVCKERTSEPWREIGFKFTNIQNLSIVNITVHNCGVSSQKQFLTRHVFYSAIFLVHCTHVYISGVRVLQSVGSGLAIIDTNGTVTVEDTLFESNGIGGIAEIVGAGGLYLQYSCFSNLQDSICPQLWSQNTTYAFTDCNFTNNNANIPESIADITLNDDEKRLLGRGGGLGVVMSDGAANNHITLTRCRFLNNTATWGGGMHVQFRGSSQNNLLVAQCSYFENNCCPENAGGAINVVHDNISPMGNQVVFENANFTDNSAGFGGGVGIYSSPNIETSIPNITIAFKNCSWMLNKANFGSALDVLCETHQTFPCGSQSNVILSDCTFTNNTVVHRPNTSQQYKEGRGVLVSTAHSIWFEGNTTFTGNNGTAVYLVTSTAIFAPDSTALFEGNFGYKGGAIALIGLAAIHVQQNSHFTFKNNRAQTTGGAIYYYSLDQHEYFSGSSNCFIKYVGSEDKTSASFMFDGNQAEQTYGLDIRATTLNQCRSMCHTESNDPVEIFNCIGQFNFTNKTTSVSTSGGQYLVNTSKSLILVIPGKEFQIPFKLIDDLNTSTKGSYNVRVKNYNGSNIVVDPAYAFIVNDHMKLYGQPGDRARLKVTSMGRRPITLVFEVELDHCPPGFAIHNTTMSNKNLPTCTCTINTDKQYQGMVRCNGTHFYTYVRRGYWFGYESEGTLYTSHCPAGFCFSGRDSNCNGRSEVPCLPAEPSQEALDRTVCGPTRTGIVCGKCVSNHSVYYHSYDLPCGSDDMCSVGWVLYIASELLPLMILFLVVMYFDISFTSGAASGFIFFAQVTDSLVINSQGSILLKPVIHELTLVYQFIYRFFNFDFFSHKLFAFCLIKGATALDVLAFKYVTVLCAFIMIFLMVFMFKYCKMSFHHKYSRLMKHTMQTSVIHGLSAFLIMCYMQCLRVSFLLITPIDINSRGGVKIRNVVFRNGEIDYFSKAHLPYALPAIACLLTFGIIPPVLLITYPLHYRVIAILGLHEKQWFSKISKYISLERMKPLLDSFQSCFKDKCRFFAGLYFFYRFLLLLLFAVTPSYTVFYAVVEIQLIVTLAVHAYVQPYQKQLYNIIDTLIFTNLAIINAITLLNYSIISRTGDRVTTVNTFSSIQLILVFLPLCSLVGYTVYKAIQKVKVMMRRKDPKTEEGEEEEQVAEEDMEELEMPARLIYGDEISSSDESTDYQTYEDT